VPIAHHINRESADDLTPFKKLMLLLTDDLKEQSNLISEIFPSKMDVFYLFVDRVFEDVVRYFPFSFFFYYLLKGYKHEWLGSRICSSSIRKSDSNGC
jgi:glycopeptide antibiotics resistance protein